MNKFKTFKEYALRHNLTLAQTLALHEKYGGNYRLERFLEEDMQTVMDWYRFGAGKVYEVIRNGNNVKLKLWADYSRRPKN